MMQKFQDTATGIEWHFDAGVDPFASPRTPKTLSAVIIPCPGATYDWTGSGWALNAARAAAELKALAKVELDASDMVAWRCYKAGVAFPAVWQTYCVDLRAVVAGTSVVMPTKPAYPAGT